MAQGNSVQRAYLTMKKWAGAITFLGFVFAVLGLLAIVFDKGVGSLSMANTAIAAFVLAGSLVVVGTWKGKNSYKDTPGRKW